MSPKGGIRPHKRFSVQSNRSEVLFVDYIAEHLSPNGRAGVIVPEGIIFQSGTAYKNLRKMLVENYLVAVISLPAGVFNPYSGVKTSILIMDKQLAKKTNSILFVKITNDGFGLGAQRKKIVGNDLPNAAFKIREWMMKPDAVVAIEVDEAQKISEILKTEIATSGEYVLNYERYRTSPRILRAHWPIKSLGEICTFMTGGTPSSTVAEYYENGTIPWLVSGDIHKTEIFHCERHITQKALSNSNARILPKNSILIALNGQGKTRGTVAILRMDGASCNQSLVAITPLKSSDVIPEYIFWTLRSMYSEIRSLTGDNERSGLNIPILKRIKIPVPPLSIQREIVAEIESYQKIIDGARQVVDNYKPRIDVKPEWPMVELGNAPLFGAVPDNAILA
jgi:type I restriction enzyme M protein